MADEHGMPFDDAARTPGPLVAAWDFEDNDSERLVLYAVGSSGARLLAEARVSKERREAVIDRLEAQGLRIGAMYAGTDFVWVADERGFAVWTSDACTASGDARLPGVVRLHVWLDPSDPGHRGVSFVLADGAERLIVEERVTVSSIPTWGADDLYYETLWAHYLALHLALLHDVPFDNDIAPHAIEDDLAVRRAALALAARLEREPAEQVVALGPMGRASDLTVCASPVLSNGRRDLEVRVRLAGLPQVLTRTVFSGPSERLPPFLRRVTAPSALLTAMNLLINPHRRG